MPTSKVCWDSCVFISLLNGGIGRSSDEISGMREVIDLADRQGVTIITSTFVETEVIGEVPEAAVQAHLEALFQRPNIVQVAASSEIMRRAGNLRYAAMAAGRKLAAPDAIFVATALLHSADALHSFDRDLLRLNGLALVDGLPIVKPSGAQTILPL
jgi:predicted nucleic acid-binding protein